MRSLSASRKPPRAARAKVGRRNASPARVAERETFGKRMKFRNDPVTRLFREARRRLTPSRPILYITGSLLTFTLVAGLFAGGYVARSIRAVNVVANAIAADAGFGIASVNLSGNHRVSQATIKNVLNFNRGESIFGADIHSARDRLMELEWVADADVSRRYPDSISVHIVEKRPFALWQAFDGLRVIDRSSRPIAFVRRADYPHLPVFVADLPIGGADLVDAIAQHRAIMARVAAMQRVSGRRWNLILDDGVIVKLPEEGWAKQIDVLEHLIVDKGVLERDIVEIDLRLPDNYFLTLRSGQQQQQVTRGNKI